MAKFKPGNVVRLKSGGPDMTVSSTDPVDFGHSVRTDLVSCIWFDSKNKKSGRFQEVELELVKE